MSIQPATPRAARQHSSYQTNKPASPSDYGLRVYKRLREGDDIQDAFNSAPEGSARVPTVIEMAPGFYDGNFYLPTSYFELVAPLGGVIFFKDDDSINFATDKLGSTLGIATNDLATLNLGSAGLIGGNSATIQEQWIKNIMVVNTRLGAAQTGKSPEAAVNFGQKADDQDYNNIRMLNCDIDGNSHAVALFDGGVGKSAIEFLANRIKTMRAGILLESAINLRWVSSGNIIRCHPSLADTISAFQTGVTASKSVIGINFTAGLTYAAGTYFRSVGDQIIIRSKDDTTATIQLASILLAGDTQPEKIRFLGSISMVHEDGGDGTFSKMVGIQFNADVAIADGQFVFMGDIDLDQQDTDVAKGAYGVHASGVGVKVPRIFGHINVNNDDADQAAKSLYVYTSANTIKHAVYSDQDAEIVDLGVLTPMDLAAEPE